MLLFVKISLPLYDPCINIKIHMHDQVVIAQWLVRRLATQEVLGSNADKGENYSF